MDLPIGSIILWAETVIPTGWALCNGSNGTPDLRGRFVRGASVDGDLRGIGGSDSHVHANVNTSPGGAHGHTGITVATNNSDTTKYYGYSSGTKAYAAVTHNHGNISRTPNDVGDHSHTIANTLESTVLPPNIVLKFIMKIT